MRPGQIVRLARQLCDGLAEAHRLGVVHRDLKPQNICVDEDGNAKIMDFGIARLVRGQAITGAGVIVGTPQYMSPEQVDGQEVDQRSDLYSLGIILYEMATGRVPFDGDEPLAVAHKQKLRDAGRSADAEPAAAAGPRRPHREVPRQGQIGPLPERGRGAG